MIRKEILDLPKISYIDEYDFSESVYDIVSKLKYINKEETIFLLDFTDDINNNRGFEIDHEELSCLLIKLGERYKLID